MVNPLSFSLILFLSFNAVAKSDNIEDNITVQSIIGGEFKTTVIHDSGNTVSIDYFYKKNPDVQSLEEKRNKITWLKEKILKNSQTLAEETKAKLLKGHFPYKTEVIKLSQVMRANVLRDIPNLEHNMFIIGNDTYSIDWLIENKEELYRFGATGILTACGSKEEFKRIATLANPLSLMPVSADFISKEFDVKHYPVLITNQGEFR